MPIIVLVFILALIPFSAGASVSLDNISEIEKKELLEWVNGHCDKEYRSFDTLFNDRRIRCRKNKKNEVVPENYYRLNGSRHVRPHSLGALPILWVPIPFIIGMYFLIVKVNSWKKKKTNHLVISITLLILSSKWLTCVYAATIYQDQFLKGNVQYIRMHGQGEFNSFLLNTCSNDLLFHVNPTVYAAVDTGSLEMVKFIVEEMKIDPNQEYLNVLPIALAVNHQMTDIVDFLIKFLPENPNEGGVHFFKTAILLGQSDFVKKMLKDDNVKKNINKQQPGVPWICRKSALYLAVYRNELEIASILLKNGADLNIPNYYDNKTPVDAANQNQNVEMQQLLEDYLEKRKVTIRLNQPFKTFTYISCSISELLGC